MISENIFRTVTRRALGDIGKHFPDSDPEYKGISSMKLLSHVRTLLEQNGYLVGNIDSTIVAQAPKLAAYLSQMIENIAEVLGIDSSQVSVKATTEERLGFTGSGEGIAAQAVCLLNSVRDELKYASFDYDCSDTRAESGMHNSCAGCQGCKRNAD